MITAKVKRVEFYAHGEAPIAIAAITRREMGGVRLEIWDDFSFNVEMWRQLTKHIEINMIEMGVEE